SQALIHTWSLGVEEQFYIILPVFLILIFKYWKNRVVLFMLSGALASLAYGCIIQLSSPSSDFYLIASRAWELLVGGVLAIVKFPPIGDRARSALALAGVALLALGIVVLVSWLPFPSPLAIIPVLGTALIISFGE